MPSFPSEFALVVSVAVHTAAVGAVGTAAQLSLHATGPSLQQCPTGTVRLH